EKAGDVVDAGRIEQQHATARLHAAAELDGNGARAPIDLSVADARLAIFAVLEKEVRQVVGRLSGPRAQEIDDRGGRELGCRQPHGSPLLDRVGQATQAMRVTRIASIEQPRYPNCNLEENGR